MMTIELRHVTNKFATTDGGTGTALEDISLTVEDGPFCAVLGPTGYGKSTTLTLIADECDGSYYGKYLGGTSLLRSTVLARIGGRTAAAAATARDRAVLR